MPLFFSKMNKKKLTDVLIVISIIVSYVLVMNVLHITCPIKWLTGISCAGCGMTRAWYAALKLDFVLAFSYHPLFLIPPIAIVMYLFKEWINKKVYMIVIVLIIALFIIIYVYRILFQQGEVVVFHPKDGLIYKIFINTLQNIMCLIE